MAFDQPTRNRLARFVGEARALLSEEFTRQLQHEYGLDPTTGHAVELDKLTHLDDARRETARILRETLAHYLAGAAKPTAQARRDALDRIVREQAYTVLNRLCALRMAEARGLLIASVGQGYQSRGFQLYARLAGTALGETGDAYRGYLFSLFDELAVELAVLFDRFSPQGRLSPREAALLRLLDEINHPDIEPLWAEDETIGWIYQYFNSDDERRQMRAESQAPRNSRELAVRNQFFTPRYVVEFLTDNTLGRIWYEMTRGQTNLVETCRYLVRRPNEIFLAAGASPPRPEGEGDLGGEGENLTQEELLRQPVYIPHRPLKDPREIAMLDPACGSMHFGLYAFDLFERIYAEAWEMQASGRWSEIGGRMDDRRLLTADYPSKDAFLRDVPRLIVERNIHGIDIDPRAVQIAGLSLWLRAQKSWQAQGLNPRQRPQIRRANVVCAEPMPGDKGLLDEFLRSLRDDRLEALIRRVLDVPAGQRVRATERMAEVLCDLVRTVWQEMALAGEAGSLLKIEESLAVAVAKAEDEWETRWPLFRAEFQLTDGDPQVRYLKTAPGEGADFWRRAEALVLAALEDYAEQAQDGAGYQRRLFAEDAARGFAFVDLCRKHYDVILMNPPFGLAPRGIYDRLKSQYQDTYVDLYACFVARGLQVAPKGVVGTITSRAFLMTKKLARWRAHQVVDALEILVDLGIGVMDNAFVEAAAYTLRLENLSNHIIAVDRRNEASKSGLVLLDDQERIYFVPRIAIKSLPAQKLLYQLPHTIFSLLRDKFTFEPNIGTAREGMRTFDDFRFLRLRWEVSATNIGERKIWEPLAKGGEYAKYYSDIHLLAKWGTNGNELAEVNRQVNGQIAQARQASDYYRLPGATYSKRSVKGFSARALPAGCIIGTKGPAVLSETNVHPAYIVGWLNCSLVVALIHIQANAYEFNTGIIKKLPWRYPANAAALTTLTLETIRQVRRMKSLDEVNSCFTKLDFSTSLCEIASLRSALLEQTTQVIETCQQRWDYAMQTVYGSASIYSSIDDEDEIEDEDNEDDVTETNFPLRVTQDIALYVIGCVLGRWNICFATGTELLPELPDPFTSLPLCSPGMLQNDQGLPAAPADVPDDYPLRISWPGILVDDSGHPEDIEGRAREALRVVWSARADTVEQEACEILGVSSLRAYLGDPNRFFDDHLKRYSKSRRYAPIYWPLSTPSGAYTLWLYYHRLSDQILYTCVNDFVDPRLEQAQREADQLRRRSGRSSDEEQELERLTDLALELHDFRAELLRVAAFWKPNLNDGVQITAAPLWRLFQHRGWQKRLQETWDALEAGDYDWAHLALSIWPARVVPKCVDDRSLAIAHDLEDLFWVEDVDGWRNLRAPEQEIAGQKQRQQALSRDLLRDLLAELAGGAGRGLPAYQVCQHLAEGRWDDLPVALCLWPERVAEKCWADPPLALKLGLDMPARRTKTGHKRFVADLVSGGTPDLDNALVAALWDVELPFDALWAELERGERDGELLALALWPDRVVDKCVTDVDLAACHDLRRFFWYESPHDGWRRRKDPRREITDEIARRQTNTTKAGG